MQKQLDQTVENRHSPQGTDSPVEPTYDHTAPGLAGVGVGRLSGSFGGHQGRLRGDLESMETLTLE